MGAREGGNGPGYVQVFDLCDVDTAVTVDWGILTSSTSTATSYQWLDCNNNYAQIAGATAQSFAPGVNGSYAVEITENGCVDTSACVLVDWVNLSELTMENEVLVYPNPTNGLLTIKASSTITNLELFDSIGQKKMNIPVDEKIDIRGLPSGVYYLRIQTGETSQMKKIVLNK